MVGLFQIDTVFWCLKPQMITKLYKMVNLSTLTHRSHTKIRDQDYLNGFIPFYTAWFEYHGIVRPTEHRLCCWHTVQRCLVFADNAISCVEWSMLNGSSPPQPILSTPLCHHRNLRLWVKGKYSVYKHLCTYWRALLAGLPCWDAQTLQPVPHSCGLNINDGGWQMTGGAHEGRPKKWETRTVCTAVLVSLMLKRLTQSGHFRLENHALIRPVMTQYPFSRAPPDHPCLATLAKSALQPLDLPTLRTTVCMVHTASSTTRNTCCILSTVVIQHVAALEHSRCCGNNTWVLKGIESTTW